MGKSSVTLQLAMALTLQGRSVGILDVDLTGPSIPRLVGLEHVKVKQAPGGWVPATVYEADSAPESTTDDPEKTGNPRGSLRCTSLGFLLRDRGDAVIWRGPKKTAMIRQLITDVLWGETDYLLIDTPPGTSDEHIALAEQLLTLTQRPSQPPTTSDLPKLAGAVVVTTPQAVSVADVRKELNFCTKTQIPVLGVIENMSGYTCPCCGDISNIFSKGGGQIMAQETGVRFLGTVPIDPSFQNVVEDSEEDTTGQAPGTKKLLVQKYEKCWSRSLFEGFAKTVVELAE